MAALALLLLLAPSGDADSYARLKDPTRLVREEAVRRLAAGDEPTAEIAARLDDPNLRVAAGVAAALARRGDVAALPALVEAARDAAPGRAEPAARALVEIALARRIPFDDLGPPDPGGPQLAARLEAATRAAVLEALGRLEFDPTLSHVAAYGPLLAAGRYAAPALRDLVADESRTGRLRGHALHAYVRLAGAAAGPVVVSVLADSDPLLRGEAAALAERYGMTDATGTVARWLESDRLLSPAETAVGVRALPTSAAIGDRTAARLVRVVRHGAHYHAVGAAAALRAARPAEGEAALRRRLDQLLQAPALANTNVLALVSFWYRLGPFDDDTRARYAATGHGLLRATLAPDWTSARAHLGDLLAPETPLGGGEPARVRAVYAVLRHLDAPAADRVAFARATLDSDSSALRRHGLWSLQGVAPEAWTQLRPAVVRCLDDVYEPTRLAAAALLVPDARALRVCGESLYLGDPAGARQVESILGARCPVASDAPVAERRRRAFEFLGALEE